MAWLHAEPREGKRAASKAPPISRYRRMMAEGSEPQMPPVNTPYLIEFLLEIGPAIQHGGGAVPIGWLDLEAWQRLTGAELAPWEARLIRRLSHEYLAMIRDAEKPDCPPPWGGAGEPQHDREMVARKVQNAFRALATAQRN